VTELRELDAAELRRVEGGMFWVGFAIGYAIAWTALN
jgi:hypothetical protein